MVTSFSDLVKGANSELTRPGQNRLIGTAEGETIRFEAYYATFSVCSHKVRAVLLEKRIPHMMHDISLYAGDTHLPECYRPGYVKMRLAGAPGAKFVHGYTGQSSMTSEGFDPCVVPTLVDHFHQRVIVDSAKICAYLDREAGTGPRLIPDGLENAIADQIALIDEAPHVAVLYGPRPGGDDRPELIAKRIDGVHDRKIKHLEVMKVLAADDPELIAAYDAKILKEASAKGFIYDEDRMIDAHTRMQDHVAALEKQLSTHDGQWALGNDYTMTDIMWTVSLFRLKWLGLGVLWEQTDRAPRVASYIERAFERPSFKNAVIDWPKSTPPSPHIEETAPYAQNLHAMWRELSPASA